LAASTPIILFYFKNLKSPPPPPKFKEENAIKQKLENLLEPERIFLHLDLGILIARQTYVGATFVLW
jgi:hypothetical protein